MFQDKLLDYFQLQRETINQNFKLALEHNDPDGVHDLRVALKRMKALFNLVEALNGEFGARKQFKNFRRISKKSCILRDSQVQQLITGKLKTTLNHDLHEYETFLKEKEKESFSIFQLFTIKNPLDSLEKSRKRIAKALKNISPICAETKAYGRIFNLRNELILTSTDRNPGNKMLHKLRILAKETHYTFEIIDQSFYSLENKKQFIYAIKNVHAVLGDWHDYEIGLGFLKDFLKNPVFGFEIQPYILYKKHIQTEKTALKRRLTPVFREFEQASASVSYIREQPVS